MNSHSLPIQLSLVHSTCLINSVYGQKKEKILQKKIKKKIFFSERESDFEIAYGCIEENIINIIKFLKTKNVQKQIWESTMRFSLPVNCLIAYW